MNKKIEVLLFFLPICVLSYSLNGQNASIQFESGLKYFGEAIHYRTPDEEYKFGQIGWVLNSNELKIAEKHTIHLDLMATHGDEPSVNEVADLQVFSNLEAGPLYGFFEVFYHYKNKRFWLKVGQQDVNTDFFLSDAALLLTHSSFGIDPIATVNAVIPTYPFPGLSISSSFQLNAKVTIKAAVFEGEAVVPRNKFVGLSNLTRNEGAILILEPEFNLFDGKAIIKSGVYYHTASFENKITGIKSSGLWAAHILGDLIIRESENTRSRIFFQVTSSEPQKSEIGFYGGIGFRLDHFKDGQKLDSWALAVGSGFINSQYPINRNQIGINSESVIEFSYQNQLWPFLALQPFGQYLFIDEIGPELPNPYVIGGRIIFNVEKLNNLGKN